MQQMTMNGIDWLSDRDKKAVARAEAARKKAALVCAKKLHAAADGLGDLLRACRECDDASSPRRGDDGRLILAANIREYAGWLESAYGDKDD